MSTNSTNSFVSAVGNVASNITKVKWTVAFGAISVVSLVLLYKGIMNMRTDFLAGLMLCIISGVLFSISLMYYKDLMGALNIKDTLEMTKAYELVKLKWHWKFLAVITTLSTVWSLYMSIKNKDMAFSYWKPSIFLYVICIIYFFYYRWVMNNPNMQALLGSNALLRSF